MPESKKITQTYSEDSYATEPTGAVKFLRTCYIRQIFRFFILNLKIMKIVVKGHS